MSLFIEYSMEFQLYFLCAQYICLFIKVFQKELGKRTSSVQALKRSARELLDSSREDTTWVKVQLQELSTRWDTVCKLSVSKQTRLEQALKQVNLGMTCMRITQTQHFYASH